MKKNFVLLTIALILISICDSFAQNIVLTGKIIDQETKKSIAYSIAEIETIKKGAYSDSAGKFSISIPEINLNDSIDFFSLGYEKKKFRINDINTPNISIELKLTYIKLKEVVVVPYKLKTERIGITAKKRYSSQIAGIFGKQYGHYIQNKDKKVGFVKAVSYYIAKPGFQNAPFRVRIYKKDNKNDCPGEDLLNQNVIVSNTKGVGWFTVDISKYGINFPADGMYVMMEWINSGNQYYYDLDQKTRSKDGKSDSIIHYHVYGQSLGNVNKQKDGGFWSKGLGDKWNKFNHYHKGYYNIMINADIDFPVKK